MTKMKKPIDYINDLRLSSDVKTRELGCFLERQYCDWTRSLQLKSLLNFLKAIEENKAEIGVAQLFGKFRAYSFEEFVYRLIQAEVSIPRPLGVYWGEKCLIWERVGQVYGMEFDVVVGKRLDGFVEPIVAIEAKVELDSSRLKTSLASFLLLKQRNPDVKCFLVYMLAEIDPLLLGLTKPWVDEIFQFGSERDETCAFVESVQNAVKNVH
jgi:hypothetical protein